MSKFKQQFLAGPYLIWIIGFIILPMVMILYYAFTNSNGSFTVEYIAAIATETNRKAIFLSLKLGVICTLVCLVLSYPLAMILNNMQIKNQGLVVFIFMLPMWMNFMLRILAWKLLLSKNGVINSVLTSLGLSRINIINTSGAVILGMVYDFLPFMILPIYTTLMKLDNSLLEAANDLGASSVQTFLKVTLPLSVPGIISGIVMVFLPSMTNYVVLDMLYNSTYVMGSLIGSYFAAYDWHNGSMIALVLLLIILIFTLFTNKYEGEDNNRGGALL